MRPPRPPPSPGRIRRRIGAALLAAGLGWALLMGVSAWWWFGYASESWVVDLGDGTLYTRRVKRDAWSRTLVGWHGARNRTMGGGGRQAAWCWTWWAWGKAEGVWDPVHAYSVWPLAPALAVGGAAVAWPGLRAARRIRRDQCAHCGYAREGLNPGAACPECGRKPADAVGAPLRTEAGS